MVRKIYNIQIQIFLKYHLQKCTLLSLQELKSQDIVSISTLSALIKTCNEQVSNAEGDSNNMEFTNNEINDKINHPISENEILQAIRSLKVSKGAKIRNRYNQVPHQ